MNKVILMGRLTRKPEISWNEEDLCIARFTLAVDRRFKREGQKEKLKEKEEVPGKAIMFVDGEKNAELTQIKKAALKTGEAENVWAVCGIRGKIHPKVVEIKLCANRKQKRKLHNKGNNKRKMNGQPLKRFIAKQKVRKRKVSESDTMK